MPLMFLFDLMFEKTTTTPLQINKAFNCMLYPFQRMSIERHVCMRKRMNTCMYVLKWKLRHVPFKLCVYVQSGTCMHMPKWKLHFSSCHFQTLCYCLHTWWNPSFEATLKIKQTSVKREAVLGEGFICMEVCWDGLREREREWGGGSGLQRKVTCRNGFLCTRSHIFYLYFGAYTREKICTFDRNLNIGLYWDAV